MTNYVLKGHSIRNVENHCCVFASSYTEFLPLMLLSAFDWNFKVLGWILKICLLYG